MSDLIERQAVEDAIYDYSRSCDVNYAQIMEYIDKIPSVSTENTGRWKRISFDKYSEHAKYWYRCNRCGKDNLGNTDWCPNCGAKMGVEE